jgi:hypothetical protein
MASSASYRPTRPSTPSLPLTPSSEVHRAILWPFRLVPSRNPCRWSLSPLPCSAWRSVDSRRYAASLSATTLLRRASRYLQITRTTEDSSARTRPLTRGRTRRHPAATSMPCSRPTPPRRARGMYQDRVGGG